MSRIYARLLYSKEAPFILGASLRVLEKNPKNEDSVGDHNFNMLLFLLGNKPVDKVVDLSRIRHRFNYRVDFIYQILMFSFSKNHV